MNCSFVGHTKELTIEDFDGQPFFGSDDNPQLKYKQKLCDDHGVFEATIWNAAARELVQNTGTGINALWEGCETESGQDRFLEEMNKRCKENFTFVIELKVWTPSSGKVFPQLNVNGIVCN